MTSVMPVRQQLSKSVEFVANRNGLAAEKLLNGPAEVPIWDKMGRSGDDRLISAGELMLTLCAGLHEAQAMLDRPFDRLIIAELEM